MTTEVIIKGGFTGWTYWADGERAAFEDLNGKICTDYCDQPWLSWSFADPDGQPIDSAFDPTFLFRQYIETELDFSQIRRIYWVQHNNYSIVDCEADSQLTLFDDDGSPIYYKDGKATVLGYLVVPCSTDSELLLFLGNRTLRPTRIRRWYGDGFSLNSGPQEFAEIRTTRIAGSGKLTIAEELRLDLAIPLAILARRIAHYDR